MNGASRAWVEKDFYKVLGVPEGASQEDIRRAYRALARELHPDRNPGDRAAEERMKVASEAYDVLSDARKRADYDQVRRMSRGGFGRGPGGRQGAVDFGDLEDLFGGMFGRRSGARAGRGTDLEATVQIAFEDAARGTTIEVPLRRDASCPGCAGTGDRAGRSTPCPGCGGTGAVGESQGMFSFMRACPTCRGSGRIVQDPCARCGGSGVERRTETVKVRVPAGIADGARIRARGRGGAARGGATGDLYVTVRVEPHPVFARQGSDLVVTVPVSFAQAALGTQVDVPTLNGPVRLKVPGGTQPGKVFRVRGKGIPRPRGGAGDLLVTVQVEVPRKLSREARELIAKLAEIESKD